MNHGFLGYRTSFMLDFVVVALVLIVPVLVYSLAETGLHEIEVVFEAGSFEGRVDTGPVTVRSVVINGHDGAAPSVGAMPNAFFIAASH